MLRVLITISFVNLLEVMMKGVRYAGVLLQQRNVFDFIGSRRNIATVAAAVKHTEIQSKIELLKQSDDKVLEYLLALERWKRPEAHPEIDEDLGRVLSAVTKASLPHKGVDTSFIKIVRYGKLIDSGKAAIEVEGDRSVDRYFQLLFSQSTVLSSGLSILSGAAKVGRNLNLYSTPAFLISPIGSLPLFRQSYFETLFELKEFEEGLKAELKNTKIPMKIEGLGSAHSIHLSYGTAESYLLSKESFEDDVWRVMTHYDNTGVMSANTYIHNEPIRIAIPKELMERVLNRYKVSKVEALTKGGVDDDYFPPIG